MINTVALTGRLTFNPELKSTPSGVAVVSFIIANDKKYSDETNFIDCVAWRQRAEFIHRNFKKGDMIGIEGELSTRNYTDRDGNSRKAVEVVVNNISFCGSKTDNNQQPTTASEAPPNYANGGVEINEDDAANGFVVLEDDGDLPF